MPINNEDFRKWRKKRHRKEPPDMGIYDYNGYDLHEAWIEATKVKSDLILGIINDRLRLLDGLNSSTSEVKKMELKALKNNIEDCEK